MLLSKAINNISITGGAGFIGSHFVEVLLSANKKVSVFDNLSSGKKSFLTTSLNNKQFTFTKGDLLNGNAIKNFLSPQTDIVFHLAANADIAKGVIDPSIDFNQTVIATFNLLQEMKNKKIKKLVYFSGSGVYGDTGYASVKEEYGPLLPVSMYGASKLSAEGLTAAFSHLFGIQVWIFRPANIIGTRMTHGVIVDFLAKLTKDPKKLLILGDGKQSKSYVHVLDVLDAVFLALRKSSDHINLFNISSTSYITVNEIANIVIRNMKLTKTVLQHTKGNIGWPGDVPVVRIDNSKLYSIGWKESYSSREAVEKTVRDILAYET